MSYSLRVLQKLIENIILQIPGVDSLEKNPEESIRLESKKDFVNLSLSLNLTLEKRVPEIAWDLQRELKDTLERKTGLKVDRIDIYVQSFSSVGLNENFESLPFAVSRGWSLPHAT
ncbi:MAG: Asp23/Gls24 family envelope stress response protein [Candidatus Atribacteria bacterium]|nr:Asp23/Gls24 family envelope stress response protein [Candidatus Atribacteria bacterium]